MNSRLLLVVPVALVSLFLNACSSVGARIEQHQAVFAAATPEQQQLMRAGKVAEGFTPEMVRIAFGEPDKVSAGSAEQQGSVVWVYGEDFGGGSALAVAERSPDTVVNSSPTLQQRNTLAEQRRIELDGSSRDPAYRSSTARVQPVGLTDEQLRIKQREDARRYAYSKQRGNRLTHVHFCDGKVSQVL